MCPLVPEPCEVEGLNGKSMPGRLAAFLPDEGRLQLQVPSMRAPLNLPFPVRLLQGTADTDVPPAVALRLLDHADSPDIQLTLVKGADHRFSTPECLAMITTAVDQVSGAV